MFLTKCVTDWIDKKETDAMAEENVTKGAIKAFGAGALQGAMDATMVIGALAVGASLVMCVKDLIEKK